MSERIVPVSDFAPFDLDEYLERFHELTKSEVIELLHETRTYLRHTVSVLRADQLSDEKKKGIIQEANDMLSSGVPGILWVVGPPKTKEDADLYFEFLGNSEASRNAYGVNDIHDVSIASFAPNRGLARDGDVVVLKERLTERKIRLPISLIPHPYRIDPVLEIAGELVRHDSV